MDTSVFKLEPFEDNYETGEDIGSGHFAVVRKCTHRKTETAFAAKFIRKRRGGGRKGAKMEDIVKEINILRCINHPNIISLHEVYDTKMEVILVLELVSGGELFEYISDKEALSEEEASEFMKQILEGVKHLHENSVVHLDLKPENIMLLDQSSTKIKLIDFGLARKIGDKEDVRAMMGTAEFIAPEVVSYEPLSHATDMWSIGVITYILLSGASPFLGDSQQESYHNITALNYDHKCCVFFVWDFGSNIYILSGASPFLGDSQQETYHNITALNYDFDHDLFNSTSELAKDFIEKLFIRNPRKRLTVDECLSHPWIKPKEQREAIARRSAMINIDNFKSFMARKRWKQSMRVVSLCNRLSRSIQLRKSMDTLGSRNTMSSCNTLDEETSPEEGAGSTKSLESPRVEEEEEDSPSSQSGEASEREQDCGGGGGGGTATNSGVVPPAQKA
ncbi:hypothetical protein ACOMHN_031658 [Nucella lapillus]